MADHPPTVAPRGLCADIGGSFVRVAPVGADGMPGRAVQHPTPADDWDALCDVLRAACAPYPARLTLSVSIAAALAPDGRATSANVPCVAGRSLPDALAAALGRPVIVANDAACFALAEARAGSGRGQPVVFGIVLGTGVGGALVVDGRIVPGAGEWGHGPVLGHLRVGPATIAPQPCGCGQRGCLDTLGSARGLERLDGLLHAVVRGSRGVLAAWGRGEPTAGATVAAWLDLVAGPLAMVVHATGATAVPVSGGLAGDRALVDALDGAVRLRLLARSAAPLVVPSRFGAEAGLRGAALRLP